MQIAVYNEKQITSMFMDVVKNLSENRPKIKLRNFLNNTGYWKVGGVEINPTQTLYRLDDKFTALLLKEGTTWKKLKATKVFFQI